MSRFVGKDASLIYSKGSFFYYLHVVFAILKSLCHYKIYMLNIYSYTENYVATIHPSVVMDSVNSFSIALGALEEVRAVRRRGAVAPPEKIKLAIFILL